MRATVNMACLHLVHKITEIDTALLGSREQLTVLGEIALRMPTALHGAQGFGCRAEENVSSAEPYFARTIELPPMDRDSPLEVRS